MIRRRRKKLFFWY